MTQTPTIDFDALFGTAKALDEAKQEMPHQKPYGKREEFYAAYDALKQQTQELPVDPVPEPVHEDPQGTIVRHNIEQAGVEIDFLGTIPDRALRESMKRAGLRWKRRSSYWYIRIEAIGIEARDLILEFDPNFIIPTGAPCHRSAQVEQAIATPQSVARPDELFAQYQRQVNTAAELWEVSPTDAMLRLVNIGYRAMMSEQSEQ